MTFDLIVEKLNNSNDDSNNDDSNNDVLLQQIKKDVDKIKKEIYYIMCKKFNYW
jgi:hypothetical protein